MEPSRDIARLVEIMARLRDPATGCPWDIVQTFRTIAPYTIEEAYEVAEAVEREDLHDLKEELGDLLLQVVYHARLAEEAGAFSFPDVVEAITAKMIRRHPHVFGEAEARSAGLAKGMWEKIKAEEKAARAAARGGAGMPGERAEESALAGVPAGLPALARAMKLQDKAGRVGFDWNDARAVLAKIREEADEIEAVLDGPDASRRAEEVGDLLFALANLARHLRVDPEGALRRANAKFVRRFQAIEAALAARGKTPATSTLAEMDALWDAAKAEEKTRG